VEQLVGRLPSAVASVCRAMSASAARIVSTSSVPRRCAASAAAAGLDHRAQLEQVEDELGVGLALEGPREHVGIEHVPVAPRQHAGAGLGAAFDEALGAEDADRLAVGGARHAERGAGLDLAAEHLARPAQAADDRDAEVVRDRAVDARRELGASFTRARPSRCRRSAGRRPRRCRRPARAEAARPGRFWKHTGRRKRADRQRADRVVRLSLVAGNGPPWTIAGLTSTPVGQPLASTRPARCASSGISGAARPRRPGRVERGGQLALERCDHPRDLAEGRCSGITSEDEPNTSCRAPGRARKLAASVSNSAPMPWLAPSPTQPRATVRTAVVPESASTPAR
jgi:hypothetical protein